jgi:hypothetical protein
MFRHFRLCRLACAARSNLRYMGPTATPVAMEGPKLFRNTITRSPIKFRQESVTRHSLVLEEIVQVGVPVKTRVPHLP